MLLGKGEDEHGVQSSEVARAVHQRLLRMGARVSSLLAAFAAVSAAGDGKRVARKLQRMQWFETTLRGGARPWDRSIAKKRAKR